MLILGGAALIYVSFEEYELAQRAGSEPVPVELADLEAGQPLPNIYIELGPHWRLVSLNIYSVQLRAGKPEEPSSKVNYVYYPIVSDSHPYALAIDALGDGVHNWDGVPLADRPLLDDFSVLIRSEEFKSVADLPINEDWVQVASARGMMINDIRELQDDERQLLSEGFPELDTRKLLIFEAGREPQSVAECFVDVALGMGLIVLGVYLTVRGTTGRTAGVGAPPPIMKRGELLR